MSRQSFVLRRGGEPESLVIEGRGPARKIHREDRTVEVEIERLPDGRLSLLLPDGRQLCGRVLLRARGEVEVSTERGVQRLALTDPLHDRVDHAGSSFGADGSAEEIRALMPGRVIEVAVTTGDPVEPGSLLLVLEAMKMQNEIRAERPGTVGVVQVKPGEAVDGGALMLTIQSVDK